MDKELRIAVVGAGPGGSTAAICLQRRGYDALTVPLETGRTEAVPT